MHWTYGIILVIVGSILFLVGIISEVEANFNFTGPLTHTQIAWTGVILFFIGWLNFLQNQRNISEQYKDIDPTAKWINKKFFKD
ncbi:MAG: hypothetical protein ABH851_04920 [Methanobacteriota archaeon]